MDKLMKIKFKILMCLMLTIASSSMILFPAQTCSSTESMYLPILSYQKTLSDMISNYIMGILYKKNTAKLKTKTTTTEVAAPIIKITDIPKSEREEALDAMKVISTKLFDLNDTDSLSAHLLALKELCDNLDPEIDKKAITAIHFLLENQHRTSMADMMFWIHANTKYELETAIPMIPGVARKPKAEKIAALRKKMTLQAQRLKEQEEQAEQSLDLSILV